MLFAYSNDRIFTDCWVQRLLWGNGMHHPCDISQNSGCGISISKILVSASSALCHICDKWYFGIVTQCSWAWLPSSAIFLRVGLEF